MVFQKHTTKKRKRSQPDSYRMGEIHFPDRSRPRSSTEVYYQKKGTSRALRKTNFGMTVTICPDSVGFIRSLTKVGEMRGVVVFEKKRSDISNSKFLFPQPTRPSVERDEPSTVWAAARAI